MLPPFPSVLSGIFIHKNRNVLDILFDKQPFCHLLPPTCFTLALQVHYNHFYACGIHFSAVYFFIYTQNHFPFCCVYGSYYTTNSRICQTFLCIWAHEWGKPPDKQDFFKEFFFRFKKYFLHFLKKYAILNLSFPVEFIFIFPGFEFVYLFIYSCPIQRLFKPKHDRSKRGR